jgi:regulatory protein
VLDNDDRLLKALELAYGYLNRRDRTVSEVRRHLQNRGREEAAVERAIEILQAEGYLDDARYARLFSEDKRTLEEWGRERIERALRERGVDRELVDETLAAGSSDDSELERALSLLRRRFPDPPRDRRERDRALGMLIRKGYDSELALDALSAHARDADEPSFR